MWSLKVIKGAELADQLVAVQQLPQPLQRFSIGRDPANAWVIADRSLALSARHCEIVNTPDGPALRDLSTNGTFVNGGAARLVGEHLLRDGDRFVMGPFEIVVSGPPMPVRAAPAPRMAAVAAPAQAGALDTAVQRGGDPAAMLAAGARAERPGLTEILRAVRPTTESGVDLTRIRVAPPPGSAPVAASAPASTPALRPSAAAVPNLEALGEALARGLGVPAQALHGQDLLLLAERLAAAARVTCEALQDLPPPAAPAPPR